MTLTNTTHIRQPSFVRTDTTGYISTGLPRSPLGGQALCVKPSHDQTHMQGFGGVAVFVKHPQAQSQNGTIL